MIVQFIDLVSHSESTLLGGLDGGFLLTSQEIKFLLGLNYNYMVYRKQHNNRKRPTNWHGRRHDHQVPATKPNQGRKERESQTEDRSFHRRTRGFRNSFFSLLKSVRTILLSCLPVGPVYTRSLVISSLTALDHRSINNIMEPDQ